MAFLDLADENKNAISPAHRAILTNSIEQQLSCASSTKINFIEKFKNVNNYPQNVMAYALQTILKMQIQIIDMNLSDSILVGYLLVGGGENSIKVTLHFVKDRNKFMLTEIENIWPIFNKVDCFEQSRGNVNLSVQ
jgi:hypothetical protein